MKLAALVPSVIHLHNWQDVRESFNFYRLPCKLATESEVASEYAQWKDFCLMMDASNRPSTALQALDLLPKRFSNVKILLQILCTLPVSTCTAERSFSAMKLLKSCLRNSMTDMRLTGLALMYIHPRIDIDINTVIDRFMSHKSKRRRINC